MVAALATAPLQSRLSGMPGRPMVASVRATGQAPKAGIVDIAPGSKREVSIHQ